MYVLVMKIDDDDRVCVYGGEGGGAYFSVVVWTWGHGMAHSAPQTAGLLGACVSARLLTEARWRLALG